MTVKLRSEYSSYCCWPWPAPSFRATAPGPSAEYQSVVQHAAAAELALQDIQKDIQQLAIADMQRRAEAAKKSPQPVPVLPQKK